MRYATEPSAELLGKLKNSLYAVESTSFERMTLWREYATQAVGKPGCPPVASPNAVKWEQDNSGIGCAVGQIGDRPVMLSFLWTDIDGRTIVFWECTSQVADHKMIEEWMKKYAPHWFPEGRRYKTLDAGDFCHMVWEIRELNEVPVTS